MDLILPSEIYVNQLLKPIRGQVFFKLKCYHVLDRKKLLINSYK